MARKKTIVVTVRTSPGIKALIVLAWMSMLASAGTLVYAIGMSDDDLHGTAVLLLVASCLFYMITKFIQWCAHG